MEKKEEEDLLRTPHRADGRYLIYIPVQATKGDICYTRRRPTIPKTKHPTPDSFEPDVEYPGGIMISFRASKAVGDRERIRKVKFGDMDG